MLRIYLLKDGASPLIMASQNGHHEIVEVLLAANADVNFHHDKVIIFGLC